MHKPIDDINFWKQRIETATKEYYTVYVTTERDWQHIFDCHKKTIEDVIPKDAKVLDAGCGYARMSPLFSDENYTGVDFSPDFIQRAQAHYSTKNFLVANLKELPFPDNTFDWAFCVSIKKMVIDNLGEDEWLKMEKELKRVSKNVLVLEYEDPIPFQII